MALEGIIFGIVAMLGWGIADFWARKSVDSIGGLRTLLFTQFIGALVLYPYLFLENSIFALSIQDMAMFLGLGMLWAGGYLAFYKAISKGLLSIVSPVASSWPMITIPLAVIFLGETLTSTSILAIVGVLIGIVLVSTDIKKIRLNTRQLPGVEYALLAMATWGAMFFLFAFLPGKFGVLSPIMYLKMNAVILVLVFALAKRRAIGMPHKSMWPVLIGIGLLDTLAFIGYFVGTSVEQISIVAPIAAAFPLVTIALAYVFLKERLVFNQKIGVLMILAGVVALAVV